MGGKTIRRSPRERRSRLSWCAVLSVVLWDVIEQVPCSIRLVRAPKPSMGFCDFDEYERLLDVAREFGPTADLVALLGGEASLGCGEMIGFGVGRCRFDETPAMYPAFRVAGTGHCAKERPTALCADDRTARVGGAWPSSSEE